MAPSTVRVLDLVIVHRDNPEALPRTVELFRSQGVPLRLVVADNGSSPATLDHLRAVLPPAVRLLPLGNNLGFGPAANAGFRWFLDHHPADWLAVAPHDARPEPGCLPRLLRELAERPRAGLASADVGDGCTPVVDAYFGGIPGPATVTDGWEAAGHPHGTLMLARRDCLREIGLFDERYFAYCEEAQLALRAREAGWEIGVVRGAEVRNPHLSSHVAVVDYLQLRNTLLLVRESSGRYHATIRLLIALWHLAAGALSPRRRGPYWAPGARLRAIVDHLRGRYGPPPDDLFRRRDSAGASP